MSEEWFDYFKETGEMPPDETFRAPGPEERRRYYAPCIVPLVEWWEAQGWKAARWTLVSGTTGSLDSDASKFIRFATECPEKMKVKAANDLGRPRAIKSMLSALAETRGAT